MTDVVRIVFETHSLTVDNERGIATGWFGGALSAQGRALARELGERRRDDRIDAVFSSDLARAVETAEIAPPFAVFSAGPRSRSARRTSPSSSTGACARPTTAS